MALRGLGIYGIMAQTPQARTARHPHMGRRYDRAHGLGRIQIFKIGRP